MTGQVTITHADASTLELFPTSISITYNFPGLSVERKPGSAAGAGYTVDPNMTYRTIEVSAYLTGTQVNTLTGKVMPASAPTYDGTDPKILIYYDGSTSESILCVIMGLKLSHVADNRWMANFIFVERDT